ncbi:MAG: tRNA (adenosine(37)-N6)-dimethylallyltransferase MiaA [Bacteroidales bacterium]|nr:tRNA (adenosine(37)-N6)-dimethylallyltransferase MiaA [Bacteroidales bacterium]
MKTLIAIIGPTGIGKTDLGVYLAQKLETEIISSDSRQFYRELKIGTAVPSEKELAAAKHHFIGNLSIHDYYNASTFEFEVIDLLNELFHTKNQVLMVGGSGMYIDAVCKGIDDLPEIDPEIRTQLEQKYQNEGIESLRFELKKLDPEYYNVVDLRNPKRILKGLEICLMTGRTYTSFRTSIKKERDFKILKIGLTQVREKLYHIIDKRVDKMVESGLIDEAREFYASRHLNSLNTVGYKELFAYFDGEYNLEKAIELIKRNSRRYAKRQLSWFNRDKEIIWFEPSQKEEIEKFIVENLKTDK